MSLDAATTLTLNACLQDKMQEHLAQVLNGLFNELDVRLFDLTERSHDGNQVQLYFDALRQLRITRVDIETDFLRAAARTLQPEEKPQHGSFHQQLSLLDKNEQEETLQLEESIRRLNEHLAPSLRNLLARLNALNNQPESSDDPFVHPIAPRGLSRAFRAALNKTEIHVEIRLITLGLFSQHVLGSLATLYSELNQLMRDAGILADLTEAPLPIKPVTAIPARRTSARSTLEEEKARPEPGTQPDGNLQYLSDIQQLLWSQRPAGGSPAIDAAHASPSHHSALPTSVLDTALDSLWTFEGDPAALKSELLARSREQFGENDAALKNDDEDIIDLVALLFSRIHLDAAIPDPLRETLMRLHTPFLRTALREPALLRGPSHPARELLDELGELAIGWCQAADMNGTLLTQISLAVEQLASHHRTDTPIPFVDAITSIRQINESQKRRADLVEHRAVEAAIGRERLALARNRVAALVTHRLSRQDPLPWVRQLVRGPWSHHLVLLWLRNAETSAAFRNAERFIVELLWVDGCTHNTIDIDRLRQARRELPEQLRQGLLGVSLHDSEIEALVNRLESFLDAQLSGDELDDFLYENDPSLQQADFTRQWEEISLEEQPSSESIDPNILATVRSLTPGTWFEFQLPEQGEPVRARLSWVSPYTGRHVFVNRNGQKISELSATALAAQLETGLSKMIDNQRLLERNLRALIDQLTRYAPPSADNSTPTSSAG